MKEKLNDKKKAAEEVQRLVNTNFTDKDLKIKFSYEKEDSKAVELIEKMDQFAERVLQGGENVTPQETAVLPQVLEMLLREKQHAGANGQKEE